MDNNKKQETLEKSFENAQMHFFKNVTAYLSQIEDKHIKLEMCEELINSNNFKENWEDAKSDFKFLGSIAYLIGLDFCSQTYANKTVVSNSRKRLEDFVLPADFQEEFVNKFINIIEKTDTKVFEEIYEKFSQEASEEIPNKLMPFIQGIEYKFKLILSNSMLNVKYAIDVKNILDKQKLTYQDILKVNTTVSQYCKFIGKVAINKFNQLFLDENYQKLIKTASDKFEQYKFGTLFIESIETLKDFLTSNRFSKEDILRMLNNKFTDGEFEKAEKEFKEKMEAESLNKEDKAPVYEETAEAIMHKDPINAIFVIADEALDFSMEKEEDFIEGINAVCKSDDYMSSIYHYVKAKISTIDKDCSMGIYQKFDLNKVLNLIEKELTGLRSNYKKVAEEICEDLGPYKSDVNNMVNDVIGHLVLDSNDQKGYLISQYLKPSIETFQHLTQMMNLIEESDMIATDEALRSYNKIYKFIKETETINNKFNKVSDSEPIFNRLSMFIAVKDMLNKYRDVSLNQQN